MYTIDIGNTDLTVLKKYLTTLKNRTALANHNKNLTKIGQQLESIFSVKNNRHPAIPWGY